MSALETVQIAHTWNIHMTRGDSFPVSIEVTDVADNPVDVSAWVFAGHLREDFLLETPIIAELTINMTGAAGGVVDAQLPAGVDLPVYPDTHPTVDLRGLPKPLVYDIEYRKPDGMVRTAVSGTVTFDPDVTRT